MIAAQRTCMPAPVGRGTYCGRPSTTLATAGQATCENCKAALRADERANR